MNFVLTPFGSGGDVYPFVWMGKLLRDRGNSVTLISSAVFREAVERAGLNFVALGTEKDYLEVIGNPAIWDPVQGPDLLFAYVGKGIRLYYHRTPLWLPCEFMGKTLKK